MPLSITNLISIRLSISSHYISYLRVICFKMAVPFTFTGGAVVLPITDRGA
jgi:hypothetical protein